MILADTSVWVDHLRRADPLLATLLRQERIAMHPMVIGELCCGSLKNRARLADLWQEMPRLAEVSHSQAMRFIEQHQLMSRGVGFIDVHLLAAVAAVRGAQLWSTDNRLAGIAEELGLAFHADR